MAVINSVSHFAVQADDPQRARRFYEEVFGWRFSPWGPPDFWMIATGPEDAPGIHGSLERRQGDATGPGCHGFECTIAVADIDASAAAITANAGKLTMPKMTLPGVGWLIKFEDPERNVLSAMQYDEAAQ